MESADEVLRKVEEKENTLGEWSDGDDDWIFDVVENTLGEWSDSDDDAWIRNVDENVQMGRGRKRKSDAAVEESWSDSDADECIRNIEENVQTGRGRKRKSDERDEGTSTSTTLPEQTFYVLEKGQQVKSTKFRTTAVDYRARFNNAVSDLDLIEAYERIQEIFEHLLNDITGDMNEKDQVRFVLRSTQLDTPISLPFMPVLQLTPERVFSQIERIIQSNRHFRLNDTVVVDIVQVEAPQGSKGRKRAVLDIKEFLHKKRSIIVIQNNDELERL